jgi:hypothetical protein
MKDFSIVIAHRGDPMGLWLTIHSCEIELEGTKHDYEYCLCVNGEEDQKKSGASTRMTGPDLEGIIRHLDKSGKLGHVTIYQKSISPPSARQIAASHAKGNILAFLDNHCLVSKGYFDRALHVMQAKNMDMLHSTTKWFEGDSNVVYHYLLTLSNNFWAKGSLIPECGSMQPYRIAAGGHGGFMVRSDVWKEVGGYWTGFNGYGGEEIYFDLKMAMLDKTNWIDPRLIHWHYAGKRPYARHYSDDYYKNMLMCANIIGGEQWMCKVAHSFADKFPRSKQEPFDLYMDAYYKSEDHAKQLASIRHRTLEEQLDLFRAEGIAY